MIRRAFAAAMVALAVVTVCMPAHAVTTRTCTGFAPVTTACSTGTFTRTSTISQDVAADVNYLGTIESVMTSTRGTRVFRCTYTQGLDRQCIGFGEFPATNSSFTHNCRSLVPGTAVQPTDEHSIDGVQGGVGTWSCSVTV